MSKALVIKGANFANNKVTTVVLDNPVPCTGLTLSQSTISFTALDATVQLTATKTPLDTTDALAWESSNTDVATVVNGLVTCVGVGTATITATCGTQSATCSVTSVFTIVADDTWFAEDGFKYGGSVSLPTKDYISRSSGSAGRLFYSTTDVLGGYHVFSQRTNADKFAIPFPKGTTRVIFTKPNDAVKYNFGFAICDTTQRQTYITGEDGNSALALSGPVLWNQEVTEITRTVTDYIANGANGFIFSYEFINPSAVSEVTGKVTVRFE